MDRKRRARGSRVRGRPPKSELPTYVETLAWLGEEYVGTLTRGGLAVADVRPEQLREAADVLAETAAMIRAIPMAQRRAMWVPMQGALAAAASHYGNVHRAVVETGISAALEAQNHAAFTQLHVNSIPATDLEVLRVAGYRDPERALRQLVNAARSAPQTLGADETLESILEEGQQSLRPPTPGTQEPPPRPKRWTGLAKLLTGAALTGIDIAGGVGVGPLTAGATLPAVLASSAGGIGMIIEGVGALRGE
jgi:hypothetical protein